MHVYPLRGTVTYFSYAGAPTLILVNGKGSDTSSEDITGEVPGPYVLSFPRVGKHVAFDGKCLHGAPVDMIEGDSDADADADAAKSTRVTFLVNIWVNHIPPQSVPYPTKKLSKLLPVDANCLTSGIFELEGRSVTPSSEPNTGDKGVLSTTAGVILTDAGEGVHAVRNISNWSFVSNQSDLQLAVPVPVLSTIAPYMKRNSSSSSSSSSSNNSKDVTNLLIEYPTLKSYINCKDDDASSSNSEEEDDADAESPTKRLRVDLDR